MSSKSAKDLRQARVELAKVISGQQIGRSVTVYARNEDEARFNARAKAGPLYEVVNVTWLS
jgi:hypothetical protein